MLILLSQMHSIREREREHKTLVVNLFILKQRIWTHQFKECPLNQEDRPFIPFHGLWIQPFNPAESITTRVRRGVSSQDPPLKVNFHPRMNIGDYLTRTKQPHLSLAVSKDRELLSEVVSTRLVWWWMCCAGQTSEFRQIKNLFTLPVCFNLERRKSNSYIT